MKIVFIGAGKVAQKRGRSLGVHQCAGAYDPDSDNAREFAAVTGASLFESEAAALDSDAEIAVVATPHDQLAPSAIRALESGKHVLVEKPGAITTEELDLIANAAKRAARLVKIGFNHRFHPAFIKLRELVSAGAVGDLMFLRAFYGHGGRLNMEREWRMIAARGGGELLDQGVHLLDLSYSLFGEMPLRSSFVTTSFWNTTVDDNALLTLADGKRWATIQVSCSEWKNAFLFDLYGKVGKIRIDGLGGSYGAERLMYYRMLPEMGPPEIETFEFPGDDRSWERDLENLAAAILHGDRIEGSLDSARYALLQIQSAYRANGYGHLPTAV